MDKLFSILACDLWSAFVWSVQVFTDMFSLSVTRVIVLIVQGM